MESIRLLLIEDNPGDARLIREYLADARNISFTVEWKSTLSSGLEVLARDKFDAVLLDLGLPDSPQRSASFARTQAAAPTLPIVVLTGFDDTVFAVSTVRRGAQDYLVKGKIDTDTLVRTIRHAIARKLGGERRFTAAELAQYGGKDGGPVYMAYRGKVYDVTTSRLWRSGKHTIHLAGNDLTEALAHAPHGEDTLARVPIIGDLVKKETFGQELLRRIDSFHPHTTAAHFTVAYAPSALVTFLTWMFSGQTAFEIMTFFLLMAGLIVLPVSGILGIISWATSYEGKTTRVFNLKISLSLLLLIIVLATLVWRLTDPELVLSLPSRYVYLASIIIQSALVVMLDNYGKEIVYS